MKLKLKNRLGATKGEINAIRRQGDIPAVVYGAKQDTVQKVTVSGTEFGAVLRHLKQGCLPTTVFGLDHDGKHLRALIKDIQYHPVTYAIQHIDFSLIVEDAPVSVNVPIQILGAAECAGIKLGGTLRQVIRTLRVSCLPKHIPTELEANIRNLAVAQSLRLSDLSIPANVRPLAPMSEVVVVIAKAKA